MAETSAKRSRFSPESVDALVSSLERLKVNNPKAVNFNDHTYSVLGQASGSSPHDGVDRDAASGSSQVAQRYIRSWKMSEHLYRRKDCPFPTLARGLFTAAEDYGFPSKAQSSKGKEKIRIVARGYDKFFNIGEVDWTEWDHLNEHSSPPYDLTYKSNGCLILISALSPSELMVSSKHSLGTTVVPKDEVEVVHTARQEVKRSTDDGLSAGRAKGVAKPAEPKQKAPSKSEDNENGDTPMSKNALKKQEKAERAKAKKEADRCQSGSGGGVRETKGAIATTTG